MSQGWVNLKQKQEQLRALEKHYREVGWSDGYALLLAKSLQIDYQRGYKEGRKARRAFDNGDAA
jgi:hypothetical protein